MLLDEVTGGLDALLERKRIADWSNNGLQIEGCDQIGKIAFAVDAGLKTIQLAVEAKADLLVVHHGLFWNQPLMITGTHRQRVAACIESNLSLYAAHLPLDVHPLYGNNAGILEDAGFTITGNFAEERGTKVGSFGQSQEGRSLESVIGALEKTLGSGPTRILNECSPDTVFHSAGAITGSGLKYAEEAARLGAELFISGEGSHASYHQIVECGIVCLLYGHYLSETVGIKRLMKHCATSWPVETCFLDAPTGF